MPAAGVAEQYVIHYPTKRIMIKGSKAYPRGGEIKEFTPPKWLRKIDGPNRGDLFPWTFILSLRKDMMPYDGDPADLKPLPPQEKKEPGSKPEKALEATDTTNLSEDELLESDELMPVPKDEPEETPESDDQTLAPEALGLLDKLCLQNSTTRVQEIVNAIGRLDAKKDFGGKGLPKMEALYRELDDTVSLPEMREAWKAKQETGK